VHLRRALLLFAVVLGLAAVAASVSRPDRDSGGDVAPSFPPATRPEQAPTASPGVATEPRPVKELVFDAERDPTRRLEAGQAATVLVEVDEPGEVEIPDLGLSDPGAPLTPARFDVLTSRSGRYPIQFTPAGTDAPDPAGILVVRPPEE
jgi:hypothetical protein